MWCVRVMASHSVNFSLISKRRHAQVSEYPGHNYGCTYALSLHGDPFCEPHRPTGAHLVRWPTWIPGAHAAADIPGLMKQEHNCASNYFSRSLRSDIELGHASPATRGDDSESLNVERTPDEC